MMKHIFESSECVQAFYPVFRARQWALCLLSFIFLASALSVPVSHADCVKAGVNLSPPPVTLSNKVKYTLSLDPEVVVHDVVESDPGKYLIDVYVSNDNKSKALASIMLPEHKLGNQRVNVRFHDSHGNIEEPVELKTLLEIKTGISNALEGNSLFERVEDKATFGKPVIYVIFSKVVVQFWNDDLSDFYSNFNEVAAFVFRDLMLSGAGKIPINVSTDKEETCSMQSGL
ncbi:hypothetical protein [Endozoicomonas sp.]|uniref:hypothetical protein n=1 Tax=Endozoicomonas sp. TaxID=1892382 RepID=UPI00383BCEED